MKKTYLVAVTIHIYSFESSFESSSYKIFDSVEQLNEYVNDRTAVDAYCEFVKLDDDESVVRKFCILADSLEDAHEHCENILLRMFLMDELS